MGLVNSRIKNKLLVLLAFMSCLVLSSASVNAAGLGISFLSSSSTGVANNNSSGAPSISDDGRYVAFTSGADNLTNDTTIFNRNNIYIKDLQTGQTKLITKGYDGTPANESSTSPNISGNGRYVAYTSAATNLVPQDNDSVRDVFVYDNFTDTTKLVCYNIFNSGGTGCSTPSLSYDGQFLSFSGAGYQYSTSCIFRANLLLNTAECINVDLNGSLARAGNPTISNDGNRITFDSMSSNLVSDDTNNTMDVFLYDHNTGITKRISKSNDGIQGNEFSQFPHISPDGSKIAYESYASNLVANDNNNDMDVFVYDAQADATQRVSVSEAGLQANATSVDGRLDGSGKSIVFVSTASNLVAGDTNNSQDVFLKSLDTGKIRRLNASYLGEQMQFGSGMADISYDGQYTVFAAEAYDQVQGYSSQIESLFVYRKDITPPTVSGINDRLANTKGWYNSPVNIQWQASDPLPSSGLAYQTQSTNASAEGLNVLYSSPSICDSNDNCAVGQATVSIDASKPTTSGTAVGQTTKRSSATTTISTNALDSLSGIWKGEYFVDADPGLNMGNAMTLSSGQLSGTIGTNLNPGRHQIGVRAQDNAGNWSDVTYIQLRVIGG